MVQKHDVLLFYYLKRSVQEYCGSVPKFLNDWCSKMSLGGMVPLIFGPDEMNNNCGKTTRIEKMDTCFSVQVLRKSGISHLYFWVVLCVACFIIVYGRHWSETLQIYKFTSRICKLQHSQFRCSFCHVLKLCNFCDFNLMYTCICLYLICNFTVN